MRRVCCALAILASTGLSGVSPTTTYTLQGDLVIATTSDGRSQFVEERSHDGRLRERHWLGTNGEPLLHERLDPTDPFGSAELHQRAGELERTISWSVGENGHLKTVQGVFGAITYNYDDMGRCIAKGTSGNRILQYEWDDRNRLKRMFSPDGTIDYFFGYDEFDRINSAYDAITGHAVTRTFDDQGRLTSDGEEDAAVRVEYHSSGSVKKIELPDGTALLYHKDGSVHRTGSNLCWSMPQQEQPFHDVLESQEVLWHTDPLGSWGSFFEYDELNQLQSESGEWKKSYKFNLFGLSKRAERGIYDNDGNLCRFQSRNRQWTYSYDALGRLSFAACDGYEEQYRYDGFGRLQEIVSNDQSRRLCWFDETDMGTIIDGRVVELLIFTSDGRRPMAVELGEKPFSVAVDGRGSIIALFDLASGEAVEVYRYNAFGHVHVYGFSDQELREKALCPWLYCGKRLLKRAQAYDFGSRRYFLHTFRWAERDPLGLVDTPDDRVYVRNNPVAFVDPVGLLPSLISWSDVANSASTAVKTVAGNMYKSLTFAKQRLDWFLEIRSTYEDLFFDLVGQIWARLLGYNPDPSTRGAYGGEEIHPKVRITLINGILTGIPEAEENASFLSTTHGKIPVHFVYAATEGFSTDLFHAFLGKAGFMSRQAKMLVSLWKDLIQEMGGPEGGGVILHYAHSLGATDTLNALQRLDPAERRCIRVATFGSPTLIEEGECGRVDNYVSMNDGVPTLALSRYHTGGENIHFIPSEIAFPLDHFLLGKTYRTVIETLGQKFQEEFLKAQ